jgi:hypothetical protein
MADGRVSFIFGKQHNNCSYFRDGSIQGLGADLFNVGSATVLFIFIFFKNNHFKNSNFLRFLYQIDNFLLLFKYKKFL